MVWKREEKYPINEYKIQAKPYGIYDIAVCDGETAGCFASIALAIPVGTNIASKDIDVTELIKKLTESGAIV